MISEQTVREILSQYQKFEWQLRRVLLTEALIASLDITIFGECEIIRSDLDAAWFSRAAKHGKIAWELRALNDFPFAIVEVVDKDTSESDLQDIRERTEVTMRVKLENRTATP